MSDIEPIRLTDAEIADLLDRYGGDPTRWPAARARDVELALAESAAAAREMQAARALDAWLDGLRRHEAPIGLEATIMARVARLDRVERADSLERFVGWLTARLWRPVLVGALPVLAGLAIGLATPEPTDTDLAGQIGALAFVDLYAELNDAEQP
jgi:hypothetical protein